MKLTKSKLKRLIKEEISNLDEGFFGGGGPDWHKHANTLRDIDQDLRELGSNLEVGQGYEQAYPVVAKAYFKIGKVLDQMAGALSLLEDGEENLHVAKRMAPGWNSGLDAMIAAWKDRRAEPAGPAEEESVEIDVEEEV